MMQDLGDDDKDEKVQGAESNTGKRTQQVTVWTVQQLWVVNAS